MIKIFKTIDGELTEVNEATKDCWVVAVKPDKDEMKEILELSRMDEIDLQATIDIDERPHIQNEDDYTMIFVDIPSLEERNEKDWFRTVPLTIVLAKSMIFTICTESNVVLDRFMSGKIKNFNTAHKTRFILQILYQNSTAYLTYLRVIDRMTDHAEDRLKGSVKNKELIELMELEKSLVYFTTALKANELVLERLLRDSSIKRYPEDEELLEDVIIENKQAIEMANIYSGILSGTMDAYASIISNNQNIVMKTLTVFTIILSIPNIIFSAYGMNLERGGMPFALQNSGFLIVVLIAIVVSGLFGLVLTGKKWSWQ